jgi:cellulose synthase/poly-beta-1,6-N-acetylglucosamine synthase-like glycosyltransferase
MKFTSETFRGQRIEFSDDSFLTACGLMLGRCVAQFSSVGYTDFPNKFSHLLRQQLRWMRGSFIRGFWRIAFFNVTSFVFWRQLLTWLTFAITTVLSMQIIVFFVTQGTFLTLLFMLIIPLILNMLLSLSYFAIHREGMQIKQKFKIFALFPLAMVWNFFVLRTIRLIGYLTHKQTGWGTREKVEL